MQINSNCSYGYPSHTYMMEQKKWKKYWKNFVSHNGPGPTYLSQLSLHIFTNHSGAE